MQAAAAKAGFHCYYWKDTETSADSSGVNHSPQERNTFSKVMFYSSATKRYLCNYCTVALCVPFWHTHHPLLVQGHLSVTTHLHIFSERSVWNHPFQASAPFLQALPLSPSQQDGAARTVSAAFS